MISEVYNMDCMDFMRDKPDKFFDLAIVDPPYGININNSIGRRKGDKHSGHKKALWDNDAPPAEYFVELFRISKNQIIWGANHFISRMPFDSSCWLMWDKGFSEDLSFAQFELAWTSFTSTCKKYETPTNLQGLKKIHPTQKPVQLYRWLLKNYANKNRCGSKHTDEYVPLCTICKDSFTILDTHLGSGSSRIAADEMGFNFYGTELDKDYFGAQEIRFKQYKSQLKMFV